MDGVPGLTFRGIMPGETFTYRFPDQAGRHLLVSQPQRHQLQTGHVGALLLVPRETEPYATTAITSDPLTDWTDEDPMTIVSNLKQQTDYYNYQQRTLARLSTT